MSIKLELDAESIKNAITTHISNQGFDLTSKTVDVALVNGRGGNGNRATVTISDATPDLSIPLKRSSHKLSMEEKQLLNIAEKEVLSTKVKTELKDALMEEIMPEISQGEVELGEVTAYDELPENNTDQSMYLAQDMAVADDIMKAAEGSDPFADEDAGLFPVIEPEDVEIPKSLF